MKKLIAAILLLTGCGSDPTLEIQRFGFYSPGSTTKNSRDGMAGTNPKCSGGGDHQVFVVYGAGGGYSLWDNDCKLVFEKSIQPGRAGSIQSYDDKTIEFIHSGRVYTISRLTGDILKNERVGGIDKTKDTQFLNVSMETNLLIEGVEVSETFSYPRSIDQMNGFYAVSDTFGHRVVIYQGQTKVDEIFEYYPNQAVFIDQENLLITGEHTNRVSRYNLTTKQMEILYGCQKHEIYTDLKFGLSEITSVEKSGDVTLLSGLGVCAIENNEGEETLYSPNGARTWSEGLIISDSDNHRVIQVDNHGKILRTIDGLNEPVKAMVLE